MKWSIDEKAKHRIVGLAVILSVLGAALPFIVGKNDILMDEGIRVSVEMPRKPMMPSVKTADVAEVFQTEEVAHVELPTVPAIKEVVLPSKVVSAPKILLTKPAVKIASKPVIKPVVKPISKVIAKPNLVAPKSLHRYTIQLANLSQKTNADALVSKLKAKGFTHVIVIPYKTASNAINYKVRVGSDTNRDNMQAIQKRLQEAVKMEGIIVQGVS